MWLYLLVAHQILTLSAKGFVSRPILKRRKVKFPPVSYESVTPCTRAVRRDFYSIFSGNSVYVWLHLRQELYFSRWMCRGVVDRLERLIDNATHALGYRTVNPA